MNKHIQDTLKEFKEKFVMDVLPYKHPEMVKDYIKVDEYLDFLQKALEDIYQKGREDEAYEVTKPINLDDYFNYTRWPEGRF